MYANWWLVGVAGKRVPRLTRAEKGKSLLPPRKPVKWQPPSPPRPTAAVGVTTRARRALDYQWQEKADADEKIWDVLQEYQAPESRGRSDSMGTLNLEFEEVEYEEPDFLATTPTCGAGNGGGQQSPQGEEVEPEPVDVEGTWNVERAGWAVLVPNRFLSDCSFHTGYTPSWTQGDVVGEYVHARTLKRMVVCDLGGFRDAMHFEACDVRMATGPEMRAQGSEGGHGYGWSKRQFCFQVKEPRMPGTGKEAQFAGTGVGTGVQGQAKGAGENAGLGRGFQTRSILEYVVPEDEEGPRGTQDSTARSVFP